MLQVKIWQTEILPISRCHFRQPLRFRSLCHLPNRDSRLQCHQGSLHCRLQNTVTSEEDGLVANRNSSWHFPSSILLYLQQTVSNCVYASTKNHERSLTSRFACIAAQHLTSWRINCSHSVSMWLLPLRSFYYHHRSRLQKPVDARFNIKAMPQCH